MKKMLVALLLCQVIHGSMAQQKTPLNLVVGTYTTNCESNGVYVYDFNTQTGELQLKKVSPKLNNPSYITVSEGNDRIYAVGENGTTSTITALNYSPKSGEMNIMNTIAVPADPCYIINDDDNVISANYSGGSVAVFKKSPDGLSTMVQEIQHQGKGFNPSRQEAPHVHMVALSPDKKYLLATDLGLDKIDVYSYNPKAEKEVLQLKQSFSTELGSGPRHFAFSKSGKLVFVLQELDGKISTLGFENGTLKQLGQTTIIAEAGVAEGAAADIHLSPDGKFIYASNRGNTNDISVFRVLKGGKLEFVDRIKSGGKGPRNFVIDPTGKFLLVGHQYTNDIVVFKRNTASGKLSETKQKVSVCAPVCLVFTPAE